MHRVRRQDLPFVGSSHQVVAADRGDVGVSAFRCVGEAPLVQLDVHLSPRFVQENLPVQP